MFSKFSNCSFDKNGLLYSPVYQLLPNNNKHRFIWIIRGSTWFSFFKTFYHTHGEDRFPYRILKACLFDTILISQVLSNPQTVDAFSIYSHKMHLILLSVDFIQNALK
jgi:hypothetical protein